MLRILTLALLVLLFVQATGSPAFAVADGCTEGCPGEEPGGQCPPDCVWCGCCPCSRSLVVACIAVPAPPEWRENRLDETVPLIAATDPREITHVPRILL